MATFTAFTNILPDPNNAIGDGGQSLTTGNGGTAGPGYASMDFSSKSPTQISRTNSGRVITRSTGAHSWDISIKYNPMTRDQFEPVYSFLIQQGKLNPFYIQLPNQFNSRNSAFTTYTQSTSPTSAAAYNQGGEFMVQATHSSTQTTEPQVGDMFTITDSNDSLHTKSYRVTRVMNNATYHSGLHSQPSTSQRIVYFTPNLQRSVSSGATIDYYQPLIRVILKADVQQYSLGTNNLYQFSLNLEEAQA
tara:strand:+ start:5164 stop:5907 length:744 start_codon:yes stop_codon:yes gene_type:complete